MKVPSPFGSRSCAARARRRRRRSRRRPPWRPLRGLDRRRAAERVDRGLPRDSRVLTPAAAGDRNAHQQSKHDDVDDPHLSATRSASEPGGSQRSAHATEDSRHAPDHSSTDPSFRKFGLRSMIWSHKLPQLDRFLSLGAAHLRLAPEFGVRRAAWSTRAMRAREGSDAEIRALRGPRPRRSSHAVPAVAGLAVFIAVGALVSHLNGLGTRQPAARAAARGRRRRPRRRRGRERPRRRRRRRGRARPAGGARGGGGRRRRGVRRVRGALAGARRGTSPPRRRPTRSRRWAGRARPTRCRRCSRPRARRCRSSRGRRATRRSASRSRATC